MQKNAGTIDCELTLLANPWFDDQMFSIVSYISHPESCTDITWSSSKCSNRLTNTLILGILTVHCL